MITQSKLKEIAASLGFDADALILQAEAKCLPQPRKLWGLRDRQGDAVVWLQDNVGSQAVVSYAINHYQNINKG